MSRAWETTTEDVEAVLKELGYTHVTVGEAWRNLNMDKIEQAALFGDNLDEQRDFAHQEMSDQLRFFYGNTDVRV